MIAAAYAVLVFIAGWIFGKRDHLSLPLFDVGFRFHLVSYLVCNGVAEIRLFLNYNSVYESDASVHLTALIWGIFILIHFLFYLYTRRNTIDGISKNELFE